MKLLNLIIYIFLSITGLYIGFWWSPILLALIYGILLNTKSYLRLFLEIFTSITILYGILIVWKDGSFSAAPSEVLSGVIQKMSSTAIILLAIFIPALLSGLASMNGKMLAGKSK